MALIDQRRFGSPQGLVPQATQIPIPQQAAPFQPEPFPFVGPLQQQAQPPLAAAPEQFQAPEAGQLQTPNQVSPAAGTFGLADAVARARLGEFAPVAQPSLGSLGGAGGGGFGGFSPGPSLGQVALGGFAGLPGLSRTGTGDVLTDLGKQQQADVANQQRVAASALSSLLGGGGSIGGGALAGR